jgi:hypothetical protein
MKDVTFQEIAKLIIALAFIGGWLYATIAGYQIDGEIDKILLAIVAAYFG